MFNSKLWRSLSAPLELHAVIFFSMMAPFYNLTFCRSKELKNLSKALFNLFIFIASSKQI